MERIDAKTRAMAWAAALTAGFIATVAWLPQAHAELVYEDNAGTSAAATPQEKLDAAQANDRSELRQALSASEKVRASEQAEASAQAPKQESIPTYPDTAPAQAAASDSGTSVAQMNTEAAAPSDPSDDVQNMTRTELIRRERVREEIRNEDALEERLEELRLKDEQRRAQQILGQSDAADTGPTQVNLPKPLYGDDKDAQKDQVAPPATEAVGAAASEQAAAPQALSVAPPVEEVRSAQDSQASAAESTAGTPAPTPGVQLAGVSSVMNDDQAENVSAMSARIDSDRAAERTRFSITPRAGLGGMSGNTGFNINPRFAGGIGVGIATSDYLSFEVGYTYSEYGVSIASDNPVVQSIQSWQAYNGNPNSMDTLAFKRNVIDAGVKLSLLDRDAMVRPFIGGGAGFSWGYLNYDQQILQYMNQGQAYGSDPMSSDYELSQYLGYLSAGLDVKMSKSISLNVTGKYYAVLSSSENQSLNPYGFYNGAYGYQGYVPSRDKSYVGGSLAKSSSFTILGGASFAF